MIDFNSVTDIIYQAGQNLKKHFGNTKATHYKTTLASDVVTKLD